MMSRMRSAPAGCSPTCHGDGWPITVWAIAATGTTEASRIAIAASFRIIGPLPMHLRRRPCARFRIAATAVLRGFRRHREPKSLRRDATYADYVRVTDRRGVTIY